MEEGLRYRSGIDGGVSKQLKKYTKRIHESVAESIQIYSPVLRALRDNDFEVEHTRTAKMQHEERLLKVAEIDRAAYGRALDWLGARKGELDNQRGEAWSQC